MNPSLNYDSPRALREYLEKKNLGMQKKFGQNFMINGEARRTLADALGLEKGEDVWEIGPGLGAMTLELLKRGGRVTAFEIDKGFCSALGELFAGEDDFTLVCGDVTKTWRNARPAAYLFGNLPYNIGAFILAEFIEARRYFKRVVVTVQREVARRMTARPGGKDYSSFSVLCASAYTVKPLALLKPASFFPPPHVDSQAVCMELKETDFSGMEPPVLGPLIRCLFSSRRKTLRNNLQKFLSARIIREEAVSDLCLGILEECGISPQERAENLGLDEFYSLALAAEKAIKTFAVNRR